MPPETPPTRSANSLAKNPNSSIEKHDAEDVCASFFDLDAIDLGIARTGFDVIEEIDTLVKISRESPKDAVRVAALKQIRAIMKDALIVGGRIGQKKLQAHSEVDGQQITATATVHHLITKANKDDDAFDRIPEGIKYVRSQTIDAQTNTHNKNPSGDGDKRVEEDTGLDSGSGGRGGAGRPASDSDTTDPLRIDSQPRQSDSEGATEEGRDHQEEVQ